MLDTPLLAISIKYGTCIFPFSFTDLFFGGENHSTEQTTSFTCPLCGQVGFSEAGLRDHVTKQHSDPSMLQEVICPVCAAHPTGDPNHLTDDLPTHLTMEHRAFRDMEISFLMCEPASSPHPTPSFSILHTLKHMEWAWGCNCMRPCVCS